MTTLTHNTAHKLRKRRLRTILNRRECGCSEVGLRTTTTMQSFLAFSAANLIVAGYKLQIQTTTDYIRHFGDT